MPFTEQELRAVLEDNSAEVPPVSDLTVEDPPLEEVMSELFARNKEAP